VIQATRAALLPPSTAPNLSRRPRRLRALLRSTPRTKEPSLSEFVREQKSGPKNGRGIAVLVHHATTRCTRGPFRLDIPQSTFHDLHHDPKDPSRSILNSIREAIGILTVAYTMRQHLLSHDNGNTGTTPRKGLLMTSLHHRRRPTHRVTPHRPLSRSRRVTALQVGVLVRIPIMPTVAL